MCLLHDLDEARVLFLGRIRFEVAHVVLHPRPTTVRVNARCSGIGGQERVEMDDPCMELELDHVVQDRPTVS